MPQQRHFNFLTKLIHMINYYKVILQTGKKQQSRREWEEIFHFRGQKGIWYLTSRE